MDIQNAIKNLLEHRSLSADEMADVMHSIMTGDATQAQIGGFLIALRMKGETVNEITGAAQVMRKLATPVKIDLPHLVDTCGTGGDSSGIFNVSTASAFVVAVAGGHVAKHGNRSISSKSGSADLLEIAGVNLSIAPDQVAQCITEIGVGFMFAIHHHGAMKHAIGPRRELGVRTIFNLLGPLTNPAGAPNQVLGVFSKEWVRPIAEVLQNLGSKHVLVVHSADGLDEISVAAETYVAELVDDQIREYTVTPEQFGLSRGELQNCIVAGAEESLALINKALQGGASAAGDMIALNAGAAIYAADLCDNLQQGINMAKDILTSGKAKAKLDALVSFTNQFR